MSRSSFLVLFTALALASGCAQNGSQSQSAPEKGDPDYLKAKNPGSAELYLAEEPGEGANAFREMYIAPVDLSKMQIIQPEGVETDAEWEVSDVESEVLTQAVNEEFSTTLSLSQPTTLWTLPIRRI